MFLTGCLIALIIAIFIGVEDKRGKLGYRAWKKIFHIGFYINICNGLIVVSTFAYRGIILSLPGIFTFSNLLDAILTLGLVFIMPLASLMSIVKGESIFLRCLTILYILYISTGTTLLVLNFLHNCIFTGRWLNCY